MKYFSNLKYGWVNLNIYNFSCSCSYIQNIPLTILEAYKEFYDKDYCVIILDHEGYESEIIITSNGVQIFSYKDKIYHYDLTKYYNTYVKKLNLLKDLCSDIIDNIDEWTKWMYLGDTEDIHYQENVNRYKNAVLDYARICKI